VSEKVDMVIFAGDAYKDRSPAPTFQREWQRRIIRLSRAGIPTLLLIGNHDISPAVGRAHTIQEFATLEVPHIHVLDRPAFLSPPAAPRRRTRHPCGRTSVSRRGSSAGTGPRK
jgi:exonuclease SbcD